jgi:large subunit ribosomal protein L5
MAKDKKGGGAKGQAKGGAPKGGAPKGGQAKGGQPPQQQQRRQQGDGGASRRAAAPEFRDDLGVGYKPRLRVRYGEEILPALRQELGLQNVMAVPRLTKIVLNMGLGEAVRDTRILEIAARDLGVISGQKPVITKARKSIAGFKVRAGMPIGAKVTMRGDRMWEFCDRLLSIAIPRIRDFRGLDPNAFDGRGNYTMGMTDQLNFPEVDYDKVERQLGMDLTFVTTARTDDEGYALLRMLGFPLREREAAVA